MDFANDNGRQWGAGQLKTLKNSPGGPKIALAYMSIGEAENYRFYWQQGWKPGNPSWLGVTDPDWPGDYRVKYWDPGWQAIIFGSPGAYLDRIIAQGFDGVYLDLVDSYELYPGRPTARQEMIDFVKAMSAYAKSKRPNFKVVPQNASPLINDASYQAAIDGIGQEELSYGWNSVDEAVTPTAVRNGITANLDKMVAAHKLVLVVDYTRQAAKINAAYAYSASHHFVEYCTVRNLDRLIVNAGHAPD
jgi:cysteinyl-tRNA synthetase